MEIGNYFQYVTQEFNNSVLDLAKQNGFCPSEYVGDFWKLERIAKQRTFL